MVKTLRSVHGCFCDRHEEISDIFPISFADLSQLNANISCSQTGLFSESFYNLRAFNTSWTFCNIYNSSFGSFNEQSYPFRYFC